MRTSSDFSASIPEKTLLSRRWRNSYGPELPGKQEVDLRLELEAHMVFG